MYSGNFVATLYLSSQVPSNLEDASVRFEGDPARKVPPFALFSL
jgi:hypothetical protein